MFYSLRFRDTMSDASATSLGFIDHSDHVYDNVYETFEDAEKGLVEFRKYIAEHFATPDVNAAYIHMMPLGHYRVKYREGIDGKWFYAKQIVRRKNGRSYSEIIRFDKMSETAYTVQKLLDAGYWVCAEFHAM